MTEREPARQWRTILADALADQEVISVGATVRRYLGRPPTRAEITAARRAAHRLADSGCATAYSITSPELDRRGSARLLLARPGAELDDNARLSGTRKLNRLFEPAVMAQDLAKSVEVLAKVDAIPTADVDQAAIDPLLASVNASLVEPRRIRRQLTARSAALAARETGGPTWLRSQFGLTNNTGKVASPVPRVPLE